MLQRTGKRGLAAGGHVRDRHDLLGQDAPRRERGDVRGHWLRVQHQSELSTGILYGHLIYHHARVH